MNRPLTFHNPPLCLDRFFLVFFHDAATTEIYTLSLHDALPIYGFLDVTDAVRRHAGDVVRPRVVETRSEETRLNSSHGYISYAVFCLKKKNRQPPWSISRMPYAGAA